MRLKRRIGIALTLAGMALLALSADPYCEDVISSVDFLKRGAWALMLMIGGWNMYKKEEY